jgi:hypothetical protein
MLTFSASAKIKEARSIAPGSVHFLGLMALLGFIDTFPKKAFKDVMEFP